MKQLWFMLRWHRAKFPANWKWWVVCVFVSFSTSQLNCPPYNWEIEVAVFALATMNEWLCVLWMISDILFRNGLGITTCNQFSAMWKTQNTPWNRWRVLLQRKLSTNTHRSPDLICANCSLFSCFFFRSHSHPYLSLPLPQCPSLSTHSSHSHSQCEYVVIRMSQRQMSHHCVKTVWLPLVGSVWLPSVLLWILCTLNPCSFHFLPALCGWK